MYVCMYVCLFVRPLIVKNGCSEYSIMWNNLMEERIIQADLYVERFYFLG